MRAVTSEAPPGGQGTTNLIDFDGHLSCAIDWPFAIASPSANATTEKIRDSLSIEFFCCFVPSIIGAGKHTRCLSIISPCIAANDKNPPLSRKAEPTTLSRRKTEGGWPTRQPRPSGWCTLPGYTSVSLPDRFQKSYIGSLWCLRT